MILVGPPGPLIDAICAAVAAAAGDALVIVRDTPGAIDPNEPNRLHVVALLDVANRNAHDTVVVAIDEALASFARLRSRGFGLLEALRWLTLSDAVLGQRAAAGHGVSLGGVPSSRRGDQRVGVAIVGESKVRPRRYDTSDSESQGEQPGITVALHGGNLPKPRPPCETI